jgi:cytoskeletal protein RodZ
MNSITPSLPEASTNDFSESSSSPVSESSSSPASSNSSTPTPTPRISPSTIPSSLNKLYRFNRTKRFIGAGVQTDQNIQTLNEYVNAEVQTNADALSLSRNAVWLNLFCQSLIDTEHPSILLSKAEKIITKITD